MALHVMYNEMQPFAACVVMHHGGLCSSVHLSIFDLTLKVCEGTGDGPLTHSGWGCCCPLAMIARKAARCTDDSVLGGGEGEGILQQATEMHLYLALAYLFLWLSVGS